MRSCVVRLTASLPLLGLVAACASPTGVSPTDITPYRALWDAQGPTSYSYQYEVDQFLISYAGKAIRVFVSADTVDSAVVVATGEALGRSFPTVDGLFDEAIRMAHDGRLTEITFDPVLGYPTRMAIAGPPDGSGTVLASQLH